MRTRASIVNTYRSCLPWYGGHQRTGPSRKSCSHYWRRLRPRLPDRPSRTSGSIPEPETCAPRFTGMGHTLTRRHYPGNGPADRLAPGHALAASSDWRLCARRDGTGRTPADGTRGAMIAGLAGVCDAGSLFAKHALRPRWHGADGWHAGRGCVVPTLNWGDGIDGE